MTTPTLTTAAFITAAAARLDQLIDALPKNEWGDTPWHAEECAEDEDDGAPGHTCIVAQGEYKPFDEPQVPLIQYIADCETPAHAAYIATMGAPLGEALAASLRNAVDLHEPKRCRKHEGCAPMGCDWCGDEDFPCADLRHALTLAEHILGRKHNP